MNRVDRTWLRRMAADLIQHAGEVLPPSRAHWAEAMAAEFDYIPGDGAAWRWALGCVLASYSERIRIMSNVNPLVSRWVLLVEMLGFFSFPTLGLIAILGNLSAVPGSETAFLISVAVLGPVGLAVSFRSVVLNRTALPKSVIWALRISAAWSALAYLIYMLSRSGGTSLDWWRGYILIALLPAMAVAHLIYLAGRAPKAVAPA